MPFRVLLCLALMMLWPDCASAQVRTKAAIQSEINSNLPNNTIGAITPSVMRGLMTDVLNSYLQGSTVNAQTGTSYTVQCSDMGSLLTFNNASPVSVLLPSASTTCFNSNWVASFKNNGAGVVTITPSGSTINGSGSAVLAPNQSVAVISDGTNWQTWGSASTNPWTVAGSTIYYTAGNVGIGTISPAAALDVSGTVKFDNFTNGCLLVDGSGNLKVNSCSAIIVLASSKLATTTALAANTYNNGTLGVGATLTANANGALSIDGVSVSTNDVVLIKNEAAKANNGIYTVTQAGSGGTHYILTRATYFNAVGNMLLGSYTFISAGSSNINSGWALGSTVTAVGTDDVVFNQFANNTGGVISYIGRTGVVVATAGDYNSSQINTTSALGGAVLRTQLAKNGDTINAADFGVVCDGVTNNVTAYALAIAAFPSSGGTLYLPPGICIGPFVVNKPINVIGAGSGNLSAGTPTGVCGTEIRSSGAADNIITLTGVGSSVRHLCISSSVATGSRSGAGLYISSAIAEIDDIVSYGHLYGFLLTNTGGVTLQNSYSVSNKSHGVFQTGANNEDHYINVQSNGNGGDGFHLEGSGLGTHIIDITSASNGGVGLYITAISSVYITQPEICCNTVAGINLDQTGAIQIANGFSDAATGPNVIIHNSNNVNYTGGFLQCTPSAFQIDGSHDITITGTEMQSHSAAAIIYGPGNSRVIISSNIIGNGTCGAPFNGAGIRWDSNTPALTIVANDFTNLTSKFLGTPPTGMVCTGLNLGLTC